MSTLHASWPDLGRFWTIPNVLSIARLVLVVPITLLIWRDGPLGWLFGLVMLAILTDWFDGRVARWSKTVSDWGKVLDPIADKFAALMTVTALTFRSAEPHLPFWFFLLLVGREVAIIGGSILVMRRSGRIVMSAWAGKAATTWLAITVLAAILKADPPVLDVCLWMTAGLITLSFLVYIVRYLNTIRRSPPPSQDAGEDETPLFVEAPEASGDAEDVSADSPTRPPAHEAAEPTR